MIDPARLQRLANLKGKCKMCDGKAYVLGSSKYLHYVGCPDCAGGEVFLLPAMVRERCPGSQVLRIDAGLQFTSGSKIPHGVIKRIEKDVCQGKDCSVCGGRGTIGSQDGMVWMAACSWDIQILKVGGLYEVTIFPKGYFETKDDERECVEGSNFFEALIAAIEQTPQVREAIEKAVGKERKDDSESNWIHPCSLMLSSAYTLVLGCTEKH